MDQMYVEQLEDCLIGLLNELDKANVRWVGEMLLNIKVDDVFITKVKHLRNERMRQRNTMEVA
jgi:hypothetical protein